LTLNDWNDDPALEAELRADAATWQAAPTPRTTARLHQALAEAPSRTSSIPGAVLIPIATAAILLSLVVFAFSSAASSDPVPDAGSPTAHLDTPLHQELGNLAVDVNALADAFWEQLPGPLRRLRN
jgi:hypothetical protein